MLFWTSFKNFQPCYKVMNFEASKGLINPNETVNMSDLHNSFMALFRNWAELKTRFDKSAREFAGEKAWKELNNDIVQIKLKMTFWTSEIEKHKICK
uniref:Uncharacterized protein n=1 Tax=Panagrolaimus superbus TaxID=310955 RepID=A0A914YWJ9_9BILA